MTARRPGRARPVILVGARHPVFRGQGLWLDGRVPVPVQAALSFDDEGALLMIEPAGSAPVAWPFAAIRSLPGQAARSGAILASAGRSGDSARLIVGSEDLVLIRTRATRLARAPKAQGSGRLVVMALAALFGLTLLTVVFFPAFAGAAGACRAPEGTVYTVALASRIDGLMAVAGLGLPLPPCTMGAGAG